ncbi:hypothetical protein [Pseudomonas sp. 5Ae-yellow]|uniref:hypothetical protein n=1 Tax=Pseudomonas sp. 5Ae-yellow TaxID=2759848 RepID=UPI0015F5BE5D|nr:hypothetical protein [Pseudomonas sp. 5Ae-yellow]MBA6418888.1 hypothetical protein [Pseudomonas sp. 5Ae-yellow]
MKKRLLTATLIVATFMSGAALAGAANNDRHERGMQRMTEALSLTSEQQEQIRQIRAEEGTKMRALREEAKSRMDAVLTAEQRDKAEAMRTERRERMAERREHRDDRPCAKP